MDPVKRCEQITLDYEKSKFLALSVKDRLQLKMHMGICTKCRRYLKDSQKLDLWLKRRYELVDETVQFTSEEKQAIKEKCGKH